MKMRAPGSSCLAGMILLAIGLSAIASTADAAPPWTSLLPFRRVEADAKKSYELSEENGPWMILVSSFAGPTAERQAHELVLELRKRYGIPAYIHRRNFDYSEPVTGLGLNRYGQPKKMRHMHSSKFQELAVLVGNFTDINQPDVERTLSKIKHARPRCLELKRGAPTAQRLVLFREIQRRISGDDKKRAKGPMGSAFVTRNPLLPEEFFRRSAGLDPLVRKMNENVDYSLLKNPAKYTVRIATFRGTVTMKLDEIERYKNGNRMPSQLAQAAEKANRLASALRRKNVEAYEFHDRHESIVTVGSFNRLGTPDARGKLQLDPTVHRLMESYKAQQLPLPGGAKSGLVPRKIAGITLDVQPVPVIVPRAEDRTALAPRRPY